MENLEAKDFIRRCLQKVPEDRLKIEDVLDHPWLASFKTQHRVVEIMTQNGKTKTLVDAYLYVNESTGNICYCTVFSVNKYAFYNVTNIVKKTYAFWECNQRKSQLRTAILTYDPSSLLAGFQLPSPVPGTLTIKLESKEARDTFVEVDFAEAKKQAKLTKSHTMKERRAARHKRDMAEARRRMATREFSSRRDSPVMVRLLQEIVAANNKEKTDVAFQPP